MSVTSPAGQPSENVSTRIKRSTLFFYGLTEFPIHITLMPMTAFIPNFYASDLGISLAVVGMIVLATRLFDVVTDPVIGYLSDRTDTRWGRRRPWLVASVPIMMIGVYKLFLPQQGVGATYLFIWMTVIWLGWTMLLIPYWAWAAELSPDYRERSVITGWRSAIGIAGSLAAQLLPIGALFFFGYGGTGEVLFLIGLMMLIMLPMSVGLTVWKVPEPRDYASTSIPMGQALRIMWRNGPFKRLILSFFATYAALSITTSLYLFYVRHVVGEEKAGVVMLSSFYFCNLLSVGFWVWLSQRIGKHRAWAASLIMIGIAHPFYLLHGQGDFIWMLPVSIVSGIAGGAFAALPNSMKADVIDLDGLRSGVDRAATFFAAWSLAIKLSASLGAGLALGVLALIDFNASPGAVNGPFQIWGLKMTFALLPPVLFITAAGIIWRYPITEARHLKLREALKRRRGKTA